MVAEGLGEGLAKPEEVSLKWRRDKLGDGIQLDADCTSVSRRCRNGWGVQLADAWLTKDITTIAIECHELNEDAYIGLVGRNYNPEDWSGKLSESKHGIVLHTATGRITHKGSGTSFVLRKLHPGARLVLTVDMQKRELTFELKASGADDAKAFSNAEAPSESTLVVEDIQAEVALAVCLGPGDQRLRLAGCVRSKPEMTLLGKRVKDFWDEENVVPPLALNVRSDDDPQSQNRKMQENLKAVAGFLE
mmetsp:Transcript_8578/g.17264  ORF Transcript_8578/g.17264 Transcript_8578/m.17264 type:complete len:248 (-) Transcript_8578:155-898(-)